MTSSMFIFEQVGERENCYYQDLRSVGSLVKTGPIRGARYDLKWKYYAYYSFYIQWLNLFALAPVPMYLTRTSSISLEADPSWRLCPWLHNNNNLHILGWLSTTSMGRSNTWPSRKEARLDRDHKHNIQTFRAEYSDAAAAAAGSVSSSFQLFPIFPGLDAWHIFPEWKRSKVPWHYPAKFIRPRLSKRRRPLQHQGKMSGKYFIF